MRLLGRMETWWSKSLWLIEQDIPSSQIFEVAAGETFDGPFQAILKGLLRQGQSSPDLHFLASQKLRRTLFWSWKRLIVIESGFVCCLSRF